MSTDQTEELTGERLAGMRRRRAAIRLAGESMLDVIATAEFLRAWPPGADDDHDLVRVRAVLENGMFVSYARPFTSSGLQMLSSASGLSPELRDLHDQILELRHSVYAHTDETPWREALDASRSDNFFVSSLSPTPKLLDEITALARAQLAGFLTALEKLDVRLDGTA